MIAINRDYFRPQFPQGSFASTVKVCDVEIPCCKLMVDLPQPACKCKPFPDYVEVSFDIAFPA